MIAELASQMHMEAGRQTDFKSRETAESLETPKLYTMCWKSRTLAIVAADEGNNMVTKCTYSTIKRHKNNSSISQIMREN